MDNKKLLQQMAKMASVLKKQQKIIERLAQFAPGTPGDPLDGSIGDYKDQSKPTPAPKPAPKPPAPKPAAPKPAPRQMTSFTREHPDMNSAADGLPADLVTALETGCPEYKNGLNITVKGNTVDVGFNADVVHEKAADVKSKLQMALLPAGFTVVQCVGYSNPGWSPSY